jgi:uncharacterized protein
MPRTIAIRSVDVDRPETWTRYRAGLCNTCRANCCTMPLEVQLPELVRLGWVDAFEAEHEPANRIAKRLIKEQLIDHFNHKQSLFTLARRAAVWSMNAALRFAACTRKRAAPALAIARMGSV